MSHDDRGLRLHGYQDDFDVDSGDEDEATEEMTDDPAKTLGIPRRELRDEMDSETSEDEEEYISDQDEDHNPAENINQG
ncbi:MAG: hypothetical protein ACM3KH_00565 [Thiobacillus sp.]